MRIRPDEVLEPFKICVPGDLSSAAFIIAAGVLAERSEILINNIGINPTWAGILDILKLMWAAITLEQIPDEGDEPIDNLLVRTSSLRG